MKKKTKFILGLGFALLTQTAIGAINSTLAKATNGELECHLNALFTGKGLDCLWPVVKENKAVLAISFHGQEARTDNWIIGSLESEGPAGKVLPAGATSWTQDFNKVIFIWSPTLPSQETWRLHLLAKRTPESEFAPSEIATFNDIIVSKVDVPIELTNETKANGVTLQTKIASDALATWSRLKVAVSGLSRDIFLDPISVTDEKGKKYHTDRLGGNWEQVGQSEVSFEVMNLNPNAKLLNFAFAVQHGRPFTFQLKPQVVSTNVPMLMDELRMKRFD
jgi:hypothetical protein